MGSMLAVIQERAQKLSPQKQAELADIANSLLGEDQAQAVDEPAFDWAGKPEDEPMALTSVELQHMATLWRVEQELDLK